MTTTFAPITLRLPAGQTPLVAVTPADAALPEPMRASMSFHDAPARPLPWMRGEAWVADATPFDREVPTLTPHASSPVEHGRRVHAHLDAHGPFPRAIPRRILRGRSRRAREPAHVGSDAFSDIITRSTRAASKTFQSG